MVLLCFLIGFIDMCCEFETFFTNMTHLKFLELYLIFVYFLSAILLRPISNKFTAIVRCFMFFIVVLQVTMVFYWIFNFIVPPNHRMQEDMFMHKIVET